MSNGGTGTADNGSRATATALSFALIVLAAAVAYSGTFSGPFVFDDDASIIDNPTIRSLWSWPGALQPPHGGGQTVEGRPILNLTFAVNYAISGKQTWSYHALNLLIHVLAGLTLFGIVRRTLENGEHSRLRMGATGDRMPAKAAAFAACAVALLWIVHPLQTESVSYIVQRAESLMSLFYLLTLYCFIRYAEAGRPKWAVLSVTACLLGMASKEVMASAPFIVLLYDRTFVSGSFRESWRRHGRILLAMAATWVPLGLLVAGAGNRGGTVALGSNVGPMEYAMTQCGSIVHYLRLVVWPSPLIFDYGVEWAHGWRDVAPPASIVVGLAAATVVALWKWPRMGFLGMWFFVILAPTSSFIPGNRQTIAEHRMYMPLAAVIIALVVGLDALARGMAKHHNWRTRSATVLTLAVGLAAALCCILTISRNRDYRSALVLYADTVRKRPNNPYAHINYGTALAEAGRPAEAIAEFRGALLLKPGLTQIHSNLGSALLQTRHLDEAIDEYQEAIRDGAKQVQVFDNLGIALELSGRYDEALRQFEAAVRIDPAFADAHYNLATVLARAGSIEEAVAQCQAALSLNPDFAAARDALKKLQAYQQANNSPSQP